MAVIAKQRYLDIAVGAVNNPDLTARLVLESMTCSGQQAFTYDHSGYGRNVRSAPMVLDMAAAEVMFETIKTYVTTNGYLGSKQLRPWEFDTELYSKLDRKQAWWGFEFETGYSSAQARTEVISHVWDEWDGVCFDCEGEGSYYSEVTFTPQEESTFLDGSAQALNFIQYLSSNPEMVNRTGHEGIGTHFNVSHPDMQTTVLAGFVARTLNNTLHMLPQGAHHKLFGRQYLYAGFFRQQVGNDHWLEGKIFRTTYDAAEFEKYLKVCGALTRCIEEALKCPTHLKQTSGSLALTPNNSAYVSNFKDVLKSGATPVIEQGQFCNGSADGGYVSGGGSHDDDDDYFGDSDDNDDECCSDPNCDICN